MRVRSYGLLVNRGRRAAIARCREALGATPAEPTTGAEVAGWRELLTRLTGTDPGRCPDCRQGRLLLVAEIPAQSRAPPKLRRAS